MPTDSPELIRFRTLADLADASTPPADPIVDGVVFPGTKVLLTSLPKVGKSFLAVAMSASLRVGEPFLGRPTRPTRVLYLTEESTDSFAAKCRHFGIDRDDDGFAVLRYGDPAVFGKPWGDVIDATRQAATDGGYGLVIVDVLHRWAGFGPDDENNSGAVARAFDALYPVTENGTAVLVLHHAGWHAKRSRGSSDIPGAVDMLFHLTKPENAAMDGTARTLEFLGGRYEAPERLSFRDGMDGLEDVGDARPTSGAKVSAVIRLVEYANGSAITTRDVADELDMSLSTALRWLTRAEDLGRIVRIGSTNDAMWRKRRKREFLSTAGLNADGTPTWVTR